MGGGFLVWAKSEIERSKAYFSEHGSPDASNRDPNFLTLEELEGSPWYTTVGALRDRCLEVATRHQTTAEFQGTSFLFDIHGASDAHGIDFYVGLKAMERNCSPELVASFRQELDDLVGAVLASRFVVDSSPTHRFQGAWSLESGRQTVCQQALRLGFTTAVQIELSRRLRKALNSEPQLRRNLAIALASAGFQCTGLTPPSLLAQPAAAAISLSSNSTSDAASDAAAIVGQGSLVFSFGSNSTPQLRARVKNEALVTRPAQVLGYARCFCYASPGWGGGAVATLAPSKASNAKVLGAAAWLSPDELTLLDTYEGGYRKETLTVLISDEGTLRELEALAYIAGPTFTPHCFTPTIGVLPSEEYMCAISGMLREHWQAESESIDINSYTPTEGITLIQQWQRPADARHLSLRALCVEVSLQRKVPWTMPRTISEVCAKLGDVGVDDTAALVQALSVDSGAAALNQRLTKAGHRALGGETIALLTKILDL